MKKIAIVGAGGFGREVQCLIERINQTQGRRWEFIGFFDDGVAVGNRGVIGATEDINCWKESLDIVVAIGNPNSVKKVVEKINNPNITFPNIIETDTRFYDECSVTLGRGNIIAFNCIVSCNVQIGDFNIFNGRISIGHDANIGSFNVVMPAVAISGSTVIGNENFFGVNSCVLQGITIGNHVRLGAGSTLIRNTKDNNLYMGNPATIVKL